MKEVKLKQDEWKNIDVRGVPVNNFMKIKILPDSKVNEQERENKTDHSKFIVYSIKILHNGEEVWCKLTGAVAKKLKKAKSGEVYTIFVMPSELKGGKAYSVSLEEEEGGEDLFSEPFDMTERIQQDFDTIIEQCKKKGLSYKDIDDAIVIKALSGRLGYGLDAAETCAKHFFEYAKSKA